MSGFDRLFKRFEGEGILKRGMMTKSGLLFPGGADPGCERERCPGCERERCPELYVGERRIARVGK